MGIRIIRIAINNKNTINPNNPISEAINKYNDSIYDKSLYPDAEIRKICRSSIHWVAFFDSNGEEATRNMLHDFYHEQAEQKPQNVMNLRSIAKKLLVLLNSKYHHLKIIFEIEN